MVKVSGPILYSPSAAGTFRDCQARFWHERHDDGTGTLPTDEVAALVSSAFHAGLMTYHRSAESWYMVGHRPPDATLRTHLHGLIANELYRQKLDVSMPDVAGRLARARDGLDALAVSIVEEMPTWAREGDTLLVWAENRLDHGPAVRAVQLEPEVLMPTRPDVIGIRASSDCVLRPLIRDYKAKRDAVDPAFDDGIVLRAFWALAEVLEPRCRWFLADRNVDVALDAVELETVNIMHAGTADFVRRHRMSSRAIYEHRDRLAALCREMATVDSFDDPQDVLATPTGFCQQWCPFLHRCATGQAFLRKYQGDEALAERLADLPG